MVVFSHRTFRWSLPRKMLFRVVGSAVGIWMLAMIGSAYGFWATKKIMSFPSLQQETNAQSVQLKQSLGKAEALEAEVTTLRSELTKILQVLTPKDTLPEALPVQKEKGSSRGRRRREKERVDIPGSEPSAGTSGTGTPPKGAGSPEAPTNAQTGQGASPESGQSAQSQPSSLQDERLARIKAEIDRTAAQAKLIRERMDPIVERWNSTPSIPPTAGYVSSPYGFRFNPFRRASEPGDGLLGMHRGMDFANAIGTPIQATANGTVVSTGWMTGYGWTIIIRHTPELETLYGHLSRIEVKAGQKVTRGRIIGRMGSSGRSTGPHLHYEVRRFGQPVNPKPYLTLQRKWIRSLS